MGTGGWTETYREARGRGRGARQERTGQEAAPWRIHERNAESEERWRVCVHS